MKLTIEHELGKNAAEDKKFLALLGFSQGTTTTTKKPAAAAAEAEEIIEGEPEPEDENLVDDEGAAAATTTTKVTLEQVKTEAQRIIGANKSALLKKVLKDLGAAKVVDIEKADYAKALKAMKAIK